jgi:Tol biopolymer transport system component
VEDQRHSLVVSRSALVTAESGTAGAGAHSPRCAPAWSPDGRLIAFVSNHEVDADGTSEYQVYTVRADGTGLARRTFDDSEKQNPSWIRY